MDALTISTAILAQAGEQFSDEAKSEIEQISDHLINVGKTIGGLYPRK